MKNCKKYYIGQPRLYNTYYGMLTRCYDPKSSAWPRYGGRGIIVCEAWLNNKETFIEWALATGYQDNLQIDRIDNNGIYEPDNCQWVTNKENSRNKSTNRILTVAGESMPMVEVTEKYSINYTSLSCSLKAGYTANEAVSFLAKNISNKAEYRRTKKRKEMDELKRILNENYCFFQFVG